MYLVYLKSWTLSLMLLLSTLKCYSIRTLASKEASLCFRFCSSPPHGQSCFCKTVLAAQCLLSGCSKPRGHRVWSFFLQCSVCCRVHTRRLPLLLLCAHRRLFKPICCCVPTGGFQNRDVVVCPQVAFQTDVCVLAGCAKPFEGHEWDGRQAQKRRRQSRPGTGPGLAAPKAAELRLQPLLRTGLRRQSDQSEALTTAVCINNIYLFCTLNLIFLE